MDDYEICEDECPKCGHGHTHRRGCTAIDCEDGMYHNCMEDCCCCLHAEPNCKCEECGGHGVMLWCPNCGWDLLQKFFINGKDQRELRKLEEARMQNGAGELQPPPNNQK